MNANAGFLFYHEFYDKYKDEDWIEILTKKKSSTIQLDHATQSHIRVINKKVLESNIHKINVPKLKNMLSFTLTTTYPGLIIGTGYYHETGVEGEFKIGFYFDYTTGMPVIPGSSVKGVLRSAFPGKGNRYKNERAKYIRELLGKDETFDVGKLEDEIFKGIKDNHAKKARDKYLPISQRDIFFDAFPINVGNNGLFADDFITPHGENPLKNPTPLKFLKVSPGVTFRFNFNLKDNSDGTITAAEKLKLFLNILLDMGAGAKTNVGYGKFDDTHKQEIADDIDEHYREQQLQEERAAMTESERHEAEKAAFIEEIKNHHGRPALIFEKWKKNPQLNNDKVVARAMLKMFTSMPSNPQLRYLSNVLGIDKSDLKKQFIQPEQ